MPSSQVVCCQVDQARTHTAIRLQHTVWCTNRRHDYNIVCRTRVPICNILFEMVVWARERVRADTHTPRHTHIYIVINDVIAYEFRNARMARLKFPARARFAGAVHTRVSAWNATDRPTDRASERRAFAVLLKKINKRWSLRRFFLLWFCSNCVRGATWNDILFLKMTHTMSWIFSRAKHSCNC